MQSCGSFERCEMATGKRILPPMTCTRRTDR